MFVIVQFALLSFMVAVLFVYIMCVLRVTNTGTANSTRSDISPGATTAVATGTIHAVATATVPVLCLL